MGTVAGDPGHQPFLFGFWHVEHLVARLDIWNPLRIRGNRFQASKLERPRGSSPAVFQQRRLSRIAKGHWPAVLQHLLTNEKAKAALQASEPEKK
jgi:hypothetical protein